MLKDHPAPLCESHDLAALDLDGVVYISKEAVPGAPEHIAAAGERGVHVAFVTNNAARPPASVAEHLRELGVSAADEDVVTSAQAAARLISQELAPGAEVYVIGGEGLELALREQGLEPVTRLDPRPQAVAQGYGPQMPWQRVVEGAILVREGLPWFATNTDTTIPTAQGVGPGNGALVELVARFAEREPVVAGKPEPALLEETLLRVGGERPIFVGDRLDTDIAGAQRVGWDSLLVLTGVTGLDELVAAAPEERPTYLHPDLAGLVEGHPAPDLEDGTASLGGWRAAIEDGAVTVQGEGSAADWWRVVAAAAWQHLDDAGHPADVSRLTTPRT